jgi:hypothetical protein
MSWFEPSVECATHCTVPAVQVPTMRFWPDGVLIRRAAESGLSQFSESRGMSTCWPSIVTR